MYYKNITLNLKKFPKKGNENLCVGKSVNFVLLSRKCHENAPKSGKRYSMRELEETDQTEKDKSNGVVLAGSWVLVAKSPLPPG